MSQVFEAAGRELAVLTPASAVELLERLAPDVQQVYLIAEEEGQARPFILRSFPKSSPSMRERIFPPQRERVPTQSAPAAASPAAAPKSGAARRRRAPKE